MPTPGRGEGILGLGGDLDLPLRPADDPADNEALTFDAADGRVGWEPGGGAHPDLATHDALGLATDAELTTHAGAADPHTVYQKESEKGAASGYASLDAGATVPDAQIPAGIARDSELHAVSHNHADGTPAGSDLSPHPLRLHDESAFDTEVGVLEWHTAAVRLVVGDGVVFRTVLLNTLFSAAGDLIVRTTAGGPVPVRLAKGTLGQVLRSGATEIAWESLPFSISALYKTPAVDDFAVWLAPFACTVTAIKAYQDVGTGTTINAFKGTLAAPTLFRSANLATATADVWADGGAVQNTAVALGDAIYFRIAAVAGAPNEVGIQLNLTRP